MCKDRESSVLVVVKRDLHTLRRINQERNDYIAVLLNHKESMTVHVNCRKDYTRRVPVRTDGDR